LKSLRLINNMLHEETKILRNQQDDKALREESFSPCKKKKAIGVQCSSVTCDLKQNQSNLNGRRE
jgi:hypothetical protein